MGLPGGDTKDAYERFVSTVRQSRESRVPINIVGGGSKAFYGRIAVGGTLETSEYSGIVDYEASELVITVRAGTPLRRVEEALAAERQMLAFEPPCFGNACTIGGVIAAGLSGPRRPYAGAVRDAMLGVAVMSSSAQCLSFGGRVMKNVAGYDVSRLMAGAMGTLGLLLEFSIRVAPRPEYEATLVWQLAAAEAHARMIAMARQPWPVSASSFDGECLRVRMSGHADAVREAEVKLAPDASESTAYWGELRDQTLAFFESPEPLWRLSVQPAAAPLALEGEWLWEWGGALRWLQSREPAERIRAAARAAAGHATLFRGGSEDSPFMPLDGVTLRLHRRLKQAFDPEGIFNPGRMYVEL
jgi:glycolate dehydrogenase FAD-binding subunit